MIRIAYSDIEIEDNLGVKSYLKKKFRKNPKKTENPLKIKFLKSDTKRLEIKDNEIVFKAPEINLNKNLEKLVLTQSIYRFLNIVYLKRNMGIILLHAAATKIKDGRTVLIGDDGVNKGKSTLSFLISKEKGEYIGDEYIFLDVDKMEIRGTKADIRIRNDITEEMKKEDLLKGYKIDSFGCLINPEKEFKLNKDGDFDLIIFPKKGNNFQLKKVSQDKTYRNFMTTAKVHLKKTLNPEMDSVSFFDEVTCTSNERILKDKIEKMVEKCRDCLRNMPAYKLEYPEVFNVERNLKELPRLFNEI